MSTSASGPAGLTHLDAEGNPHMVDVGGKRDTDRVAVAQGMVHLSPEAAQAVARGETAKGNVLQIARLAGIQGAKHTALLIPLCHPLPIDRVEVDVRLDGSVVRVQATVGTRWRTGVEMEAMTAVTAACLTVYDMLKAIDRGMRISEVRLLEKRGGRSGHWRASDAPLQGASGG
jgi:cyclic pyranopterin phosphate synthase